MSVCDQIWPCRGSPNQINPDGVFQSYRDAIAALEREPILDDDPDLLAKSWKLFDNDKDRRSSIDSRAAALMPAIGLAATLVTGIGFTLMSQIGQFPTVAGWVIAITYVTALIFMTRTALLLFVVHGPIVRQTPDPSDLQPPGARKKMRDWDRYLACKILNYTIENYKTTNLQMDALRVAQAAFRNGILIIVIGGTIAGIIIFLAAGPPPRFYL